MDSLIKELKVGPQKTQAISTWESFPSPANGALAVGHDVWVQLLD